MNVIKSKKGFTLIELMIVVAIIGILAAIAIPKFANLISKGNEANSRGGLGALRSCLSIYYGDLEGWYPADTLGGGTGSLTANAKYLAVIPVAKIPSVTNANTGHADSPLVTANVSQTDAGGWVYDNTNTDANWGRIMVNCSHSDTKGNLWTSY